MLGCPLLLCAAVFVKTRFFLLISRGEEGKKQEREDSSQPKMLFCLTLSHRNESSLATTVVRLKEATPGPYCLGKDGRIIICQAWAILNELAQPGSSTLQHQTTKTLLPCLKFLRGYQIDILFCYRRAKLSKASTVPSASFLGIGLYRESP